MWEWVLSGPAGGEAEATSDDPLLRRRNLRSKNTARPSQAKATPKMSITAGIVSMAKFRRKSARLGYSFPVY